MAIVAGIDEAGFGPVLGPMVVSVVAFRLPDASADDDLWDSLAPAVIKKPLRRHPGLIVGDSKKLYSPHAGLTLLERGVLGALPLNGSATPVRLIELLSTLAPEVMLELWQYPWYDGADFPLPIACDATDLRLRANGLRQAMEQAGIAPAGARSEVVTVGRYNRLVAATNNKATTLLDHTFRLIDWVWRQSGDGSDAGELVRIVVDRQGGRIHYLPGLQRMFDGGRFKVLSERPEHSGYRIAIGGRTVEVFFLAGGENRHLSVALASMTSKYIRELMMSCLNRYWAAQVPGLKHTAGYYTDGRRFLKDIAPARKKLGTPDELLIRCR